MKLIEVSQRNHHRESTLDDTYTMSGSFERLTSGVSIYLRHEDILRAINPTA